MNKTIFEKKKFQRQQTIRLLMKQIHACKGNKNNLKLNLVNGKLFKINRTKICLTHMLVIG